MPATVLSRSTIKNATPATVRIGQQDYGSHFQPITTRHRRVMAHEALLRPLCGGVMANAICIADVFPPGLPHAEFVVRDQLIRLLHCLNFSRTGHAGKLFLNTHCRAFVECAKNGDLSVELCKELGIEPCRVVLEILEDSSASERELQIARDAFSRLGFMVAVDDFGTGASNRQRVQALQPDYVKLDRSYLAAVQADPCFMHQARRYSQSLCEAGIGVIVEGVETPLDVDSVDELGGDLMQGYLIDKRIAMRRRNYAEMT